MRDIQRGWIRSKIRKDELGFYCVWKCGSESLRTRSPYTAIRWYFYGMVYGPASYQFCPMNGPRIKEK